MKKALIISSIVFGSIVGLIVIALGAVQLALKPSNGNSLLDKYLPQYVNAKAQYSDIDLNIVTTWPYVELRLDDLLVRTLAFEEPDTLLYVKSAVAKVNVWGFVSGGELKIPYVTISEPYIKALKKDSVYSWDVVEPSEEPADTTPSSLRLFADALTVERGRLVYSDRDDHFSANIDGLNVSATDVDFLPERLKCFLSLDMDTVAYYDSVSVRDCKVKNLALNLNAFQTDTITNLMLFNVKSDDIAVKDSMFNIERTSLDVFARAFADGGLTTYNIDTLGVRLDETTLVVKGEVSPQFGDTLSVDLKDFTAHLKCPSIWRLRTFIPSQFNKYIKDLVFDGSVDVKVKADGFYKGDNYPDVKAWAKIDNVNGGITKYKQRVKRIDLDAYASYSQVIKDSTYVKIHNLYAEAEKNTIKVKGFAGYKGGREYVDANLLAALDLKVINDLYKFDEKQRMRGTLRADMNGRLYLDDLKKQDLYKVFTKSVINGDQIGVLIPSQKLGVYVDSLRITMDTNTSTGRRSRVKSGSKSVAPIVDTLRKNVKNVQLGERTLTSKSKTIRYDKDDIVLLSTRVSFKSLKLWYQRRIKAESQRFDVSLLADDVEPGKVPRFRTSASFRGLDVTMDDTIKFYAKRMSGSFNVAKNELRPNVPTSSVRFAFDSITACTADVCAMLDSTRISLSTTPRLRIGRRKGKTQAQIDSMRQVANEKIIDLPSLIALFDTISKTDDPAELYMKRFNTEGTIYSRKMRVKHVDLPVRASVSRLDLELNDDTIHLNKVRPRLGKSAVTINGEITNWRRYLLRGKTLSADFSLKSKRIDLNQIMRAFYQFNVNQAEREQMKLSQDEMAFMVEQNATAVEQDVDDDLELASDSVALEGLIVLPKNWDFKFNANVDTIKFSNMNLTDFNGDVTLKDSRLRVKQLTTTTEVGKANMNVMYECATADSARTTLAFDMDSIQVGDLVTYLPELDSIMPMLRSFSGSVHCNASAQCTFDPLFNVVLPSVNAALRIKGEDLVLLDGETFTQIAKLLSFSKKTENKIDSVAVELVVKNNVVLIYPFMVGLDKYRLGVGGNQNLDMSFNYHVVVLKPTILSAIGLDVYGKDFDNIKFKVTSPKFKGFDVAIAKGGNLIRTSNIDLRQVMYDAMLNAILKED